MQAGGDLLDGIGTLNGAGTLAPPAGDFRFMSTHWAESLIRINFADADWSLAAQRKVLAVAQQWAPLRTAFIALIATAIWTWTSPIALSGTHQLSTVMAGCKRHPVARFDTLDGCDLIGGESVPSCLDGGEPLDGYGSLSGTSPAGEPLDGGSMGLAITLRQSSEFSAGGTLIEARETLGSEDRLDGNALLCGELLDGAGRLDSGNLWYPALYHPDDSLDGASNLGEVAGIPSAWFHGSVRVRRGHTVTLEKL